MEKTIKVLCKTGKTKEGKAFTYYRAVRKDGKLVDCHFRKADEKGKPIILPTATCMMTIDSEYLSLNTTGEYPQLWVKGQPKYEDVTVTNSSNLADIF